MAYFKFFNTYTCELACFVKRKQRFESAPMKNLLKNRNNAKIRSNYFKINSIVYKYFVQGKKKFFQL